MAGEENVVAFGDRAIGKAAVAFEPSRAVLPIGQSQIREVEIEHQPHRRDRAGENQRVQNPGKDGENAEQGCGETGAGDAGRRPQRRPDALERQRGPCAEDEAFGAVSLQARAEFCRLR